MNNKRIAYKNNTVHSNTKLTQQGMSQQITPIALAVALMASGAMAQTQQSADGGAYRGLSTSPSLGSAPSVFNGSSNGGVNYAANTSVARLVVDVEKSDIPADGTSGNRITIRTFDGKGQPTSTDVVATIEVSGGRVLLDGAKTDELGAGRRDTDRVTPGVQITVKNGVASFILLSPIEAGDVRVRITAGAAVAQGVVSYLPELREFVAAGLVEAILSRKAKGNSIDPVRIDDGFERELRRWVRSSSDGKSYFGARSAFFVKGKLQKEWLLTAAFDSDKDTRNRFLRDPRADDLYPVYGDSSLRGSEAKSADRVYLRLDKERSYALYGDFNTGDGFAQLSSGGAVAGMRVRNLGAYNRSGTGLRGHVEQSTYFANVFATRDSLKQVVEEYGLNGTRGPFYTRLTSGVQNTEKVEIITRDRSQVNLVRNVVALARFEDYSFEPFSGAILLTNSLPSVDVDGNPQYLRITYEVDQGGEEFWVAGVDGQLKLGERSEVGASLVRDSNPLSPYNLSSVNVVVGLSDNTRIVAEFARSDSTRYVVGSALATTTPSGLAGEAKDKRSGTAWRVEAQHKADKFDAAAWAMRSGDEFYNPNASISEGRAEYGARAGYDISDSMQVYGEAARTQNQALAGDPKRDTKALGLRWKPNKTLGLDLSLRHSQEDAGFVGSSTISSSNTGAGGFFNQGVDATNPSTGTTITSNSTFSGGNGIASTLDRKATTLRLGANWQATERFGLRGEVEGGSSSQRRLALGAQYQVAERTRLYGNYEIQRGLTSSAALSPADKSNAFTLGVDSSYMPGGTVFSEYRLRDALSTGTASNRDMQLATGVRNTWNVREGLSYSTGAEVLKVFQGSVRNAVALSGGVDYTVSELSKVSVKLDWRRLDDDKSVVGNQTETQWLKTLSYARKMDRDWTFLARNYLLFTNYSDKPNRLQDRLQAGFAWRPVDNNRINGLARYEYRIERDNAASINEYAHAFSVHGSYHPSRPWWLNGRVAFKTSTDKTLPAADRRYTAWLLGGRATYDISEKWDVGVLASVLGSPQGSSKQYAFGLEAGYQIATDLWLSAGYNWTGFSDKDLTSGEYTNRGAFLRLRFKFDENLFRSRNTSVNRTLDR
ncbi:hypothetical protein [Variovorax sp. PCZ-1]|uniref:hypothetical protein n=1 Tax=Variovorax sp. PCZ-1 TaxID=2835533 RepID=UPI001BCC5746|nr:hypothetical protein [Variovorax sp. PCZ-1]MBS7808707.1 hypothetical protein [Variovorax sp. PCZ-1]